MNSYRFSYPGRGEDSGDRDFGLSAEQPSVCMAN